MRLRPATLLLVSCLLAGCATIEIPKSLPFAKKDPSKAKPEQPARMMAIWSDAIYTEPGKPPVRGFGGRLYFHNAASKAVPVQGQLVVYGYDDSVEGAPSRQPDRRFAFTAEQLAKHLLTSELGVSYSIWIPWEPVGGYKKTVTLLPVFTTSNGNAITGQQTVNCLPGKTPEAAEQQTRNRNASGLRETSVVQPASYQQPASPRSGAESAGDLSAPEGPSRRLRSTAIPLPITMQRLIENGTPLPPSSAVDLPGGEMPTSGGASPPGNPPTTASEPNAGATNFNSRSVGFPGPAFPDRPVAFPGVSDAALGPVRPGVTAPSTLPQAAPRPARFERPRHQAPATASGQ